MLVNSKQEPGALYHPAQTALGAWLGVSRPDAFEPTGLSTDTPRSNNSNPVRARRLGEETVTLAPQISESGIMLRRGDLRTAARAR
ncbi:hypothetical protein DL1_16680 [Thioclava dalianensis]|jgi:hypothetical protein|uniref:Uncharacterized protein n=1 Tax=Thioclava dalianensis TaxID=1185766 RepID=A0A074TCV9_9RHOB|nr:hypothetical protein DL1_16680 [Thioclava dalianensis]